MNLELAAIDVAFRDDVRTFIAHHLSDDMKRGQERLTGLYPEPEVTRPWQLALAQRGWLVPLWPREYGGSDWTAIQRFIFEMECARAGAPVIHPMGVRLVGPVIIQFGSDAQKQYYLPRILCCQDYWCQGFSESGAGSDLAQLKTRAEPQGEDYIVNGAKLWTTHAHHANKMFALVRTSTQGKPQDGISFLLIDMHSPGITVRPIRTMGGDRDVNEVIFENVRVPQANRIGAENQGWKCAKFLLQNERGAGIFSGRLRAQLKRVIKAAAGMRAQGFDASADPYLRMRFGEVLSDVDSFEMLELRTLAGAHPQDRAPDLGQSSMLKLRASRLKQAIAELGIEMLGHDAMRLDHADPNLDEMFGVALADYLNSRAHTIFGGAAEIQLGIIAKTLSCA